MAATTTPLSEHGRVFDRKTGKWRARSKTEADREELDELTATPADIKAEGRSQARTAEATDPLATDAATAAQGEARAARSAARRARARSIGGSVYRMRGQAESTFTGSGTFAGVMVATLAVLMLYLFLTRANLATSVISGVTRAIDWFVAPKTLPF
ncbi:MAG: hypothetical protein FWC87_01100 [Acidimicrobiaceae bacterium]|nr:hypothetical protein [Acidimicrobiaceae bacterium]